LSAGRALPAVGIGVEQEREFRAAGVPFKERGRRTDEAIRIMRRCWAEDEVTHDGEFWKLERVTVLPKPVQQPMPLWIGGNSEAAMRRAGRLGDGWIPSFITPEQFRAGVEKTCAFAAEARREVPGDHFGALVNFWLDDDPARARATAAPFVPRGLAGPGASRRGPRRRPPRPLARRRSGRAARACARPRRSPHRSRGSRPSGARGGSGT